MQLTWQEVLVLGGSVVGSTELDLQYCVYTGCGDIAVTDL